MTDPEPTLVELCESRPRLMRTEAVRLRLRTEALRELALTFDTAQLRVGTPGESRDLAWAVGTEHGELEAAESADEAEPWWRIRGNPLVRAWKIRAPSGDTPELALQFREDEANPRVISLVRSQSEIRVRCEPKAAWLERLSG